MSYIDDRFSFSENASSQGNDGFSFEQNSSQFSGGENIAVRQSAIAPVYSSTDTYAVGDFVMRNGELYVCITSIPVAEEWNPNHWVRTNVGDELWNMRDTVYSTYMPSEADGVVVTFEDGAEDAPLKSMVVNIPTLQSRFDDPSPTNVREVASYTGAEIQVCQKNLMPPTFTATTSAQALSEYIRIDFEKNPSYVFSSDFQIGAVKMMVYAYDNNFVQVARTTGASFSGSRKFTKSNFTSTVVGSMDDARYIRIRYYDSSDSSTVNNYHHQLEVGETATEFEPYRGRTYSVSWEDTAGAIGAGTLDVINGTLTKTWAVIDLGSKTWSQVSNATRYYNYFSLGEEPVLPESTGDVALMMCSKYQNGSYLQAYNNSLDYCVGMSTSGRVAFYDPDAKTQEMTAAQFKEYVTGTLFAYKLATPVVYPVTPLHVETFLGLNNISAGIGASTLEYRIDTKSYIDKLIEPYGEEIEELQADVDEALEAAYGAYPVDVASGAVAYFDDGVADLPVKSLKVDMKPLQDLHGYDHPWPAGGGKNIAKINNDRNPSKSYYTYISIEDGNLSYTQSSVNIEDACVYEFKVTQGIKYIFSVTSAKNGTENVTQVAINIYADANCSSWISTVNFSPGSSAPWTADRIGTVYAAIYVMPQTSGVTTTILGFMIRNGSTSTGNDYVPYSNICPISAFAGLTLTRCGKNIIDEANADFKLNYYINSSGVETSSSSYKYSQVYWSVLPDTDYAVRADSTASTPSLTIAFYDENKVFKSRVSVSTDIAATGTATFHTPVGCRYIRFSTNKENTLNFQVEVGTEATDYEAFNGSAYPVSWETVADDGEISGGYFDATNGTLVKTWGKINLGSLTYTYNSTNAYFYSGAISDAVDSVTPGYVGYCTCYAVKQYSTSSSFYSDDQALTYCNKALSSAKRIFLKDTNYTDEAVLKAALSGQYLVYQLAEPVSYPLSAITVKTLAGANNIFADVGNTTVEFRADPTMYIKKLTGSKENDMVADANIASGKYFLIGNSLYLSTAAISAGETIVPGTNCTLTNLAEALNALNV